MPESKRKATKVEENSVNWGNESRHRPDFQRIASEAGNTATDYTLYLPADVKSVGFFRRWKRKDVAVRSNKIFIFKHGTNQPEESFQRVVEINSNSHFRVLINHERAKRKKLAVVSVETERENKLMIAFDTEDDKNLFITALRKEGVTEFREESVHSASSHSTIKNLNFEDRGNAVQHSQADSNVYESLTGTSINFNQPLINMSDSFLNCLEKENLCNESDISKEWEDGTGNDDSVYANLSHDSGKNDSQISDDEICDTTVETHTNVKTVNSKTVVNTENCPEAYSHITSSFSMKSDSESYESISEIKNVDFDPNESSKLEGQLTGPGNDQIMSWVNLPISKMNYENSGQTEEEDVFCGSYDNIPNGTAYLSSTNDIQPSQLNDDHNNEVLKIENCAVEVTSQIIAETRSVPNDSDNNDKVWEYVEPLPTIKNTLTSSENEFSSQSNAPVNNNSMEISNETKPDSATYETAMNQSTQATNNSVASTEDGKESKSEAIYKTFVDNSNKNFCEILKDLNNKEELILEPNESVKDECLLVSKCETGFTISNQVTKNSVAFIEDDKETKSESIYEMIVDDSKENYCDKLKDFNNKEELISGQAESVNDECLLVSKYETEFTVSNGNLTVDEQLHSKTSVSESFVINNSSKSVFEFVNDILKDTNSDERKTSGNNGGIRNMNNQFNDIETHSEHQTGGNASDNKSAQDQFNYERNQDCHKDINESDFKNTKDQYHDADEYEDYETNGQRSNIEIRNLNDQFSTIEEVCEIGSKDTNIKNTNVLSSDTKKDSFSELLAEITATNTSCDESCIDSQLEENVHVQNCVLLEDDNMKTIHLASSTINNNNTIPEKKCKKTVSFSDDVEIIDFETEGVTSRDEDGLVYDGVVNKDLRSAKTRYVTSCLTRKVSQNKSVVSSSCQGGGTVCLVDFSTDGEVLHKKATYVHDGNLYILPLSCQQSSNKSSKTEHANSAKNKHSVQIKSINVTDCEYQMPLRGCKVIPTLTRDSYGLHSLTLVTPIEKKIFFKFATEDDRMAMVQSLSDEIIQHTPMDEQPLELFPSVSNKQPANSGTSTITVNADTNISDAEIDNQTHGIQQQCAEDLSVSKCAQPFQRRRFDFRNNNTFLSKYNTDDIINLEERYSTAVTLKTFDDTFTSKSTSKNEVETHSNLKDDTKNGDLPCTEFNSGNNSSTVNYENEAKFDNISNVSEIPQSGTVAKLKSLFEVTERLNTSAQAKKEEDELSELTISRFLMDSRVTTADLRQSKHRLISKAKDTITRYKHLDIKDEQLEKRLELMRVLMLRRQLFELQANIRKEKRRRKILRQKLATKRRV